jgi:hypothetical protein
MLTTNDFYCWWRFINEQTDILAQGHAVRFSTLHLLLGQFPALPSDDSIAPSVRPSVCMQQIENSWKNIHVIKTNTPQTRQNKSEQLSAKRRNFRYRRSANRCSRIQKIPPLFTTPYHSLLLLISNHQNLHPIWWSLIRNVMLVFYINTEYSVVILFSSLTSRRYFTLMRNFHTILFMLQFVHKWISLQYTYGFIVYLVWPSTAALP